MMNIHCQPLRPSRPCNLQQRAGHRRAQHGRERRCRHEDRGHGGALLRRKPVAEIEDDAGEESGFRRAKQEAQRIEAGGALNECHGTGNQAPGDHHPRDPDPRADLVEHEVRRHFEQEVAEEEYTGAEAEHRRRKPEILVHRQRGEADVDAVDEGDEIQQHHEGDDAQCDLAQHACFKLGAHRMVSSPDRYCF